MEQVLNRIFRTVGFIFLYLLLGLVNSACQSNNPDYIENENFSVTSVSSEENLSQESDVFDIENDTENQEKVVSRSILAGIWSINYAVLFQLNTLINLSVHNDYLLITQIDLPPPAAI